MLVLLISHFLFSEMLRLRETRRLPYKGRVVHVQEDGAAAVWAKSETRYYTADGKEHAIQDQPGNVCYFACAQNVGIVTNSTGVVNVWDLLLGKLSRTLMTGSVAEWAHVEVAISPDASLAAVYSRSHGIIIFNVARGQEMCRVLTGSVHGWLVELWGNGELAYVHQEEETLVVVDASTGMPLYSLSGHETEVRCAARGPNTLMVTGCNLNQDEYSCMVVRLWRGNSLVWRTQLNEENMRLLAVSPCGRFVAVGGAGLALLDARTGACWGTYKTQWLTASLCFFPGGVHAGFRDGEITSYDLCDPLENLVTIMGAPLNTPVGRMMARAGDGAVAVRVARMF